MWKFCPEKCITQIDMRKIIEDYIILEYNVFHIDCAIEKSLKIISLFPYPAGSGFLYELDNM